MDCMRHAGLSLVLVLSLSACTHGDTARPAASAAPASSATATSAPLPEAPLAPAAPPATLAAPATAAAREAPGGVAASRIFIDPVTGEARTPTAAEQAASSAAAARQRQDRPAASPTASLGEPPAEEPLPGGGVIIHMGDQGRVQEKVCLQPDQTLGACPPAAGGTPAGK